MKRFLAIFHKRFALSLSLFLLATAPAAAEKITVFAAASTTDAVADVAQLFTEQEGIEVSTSFASSSTLAKQIEAGAPAQLYISANTAWMDYLEERKLIAPESRSDLLANRLVLIAPNNSDLEVALDPAFDFAAALKGRLCLGDPDHVPAGKYAKEALTRLGWWDQVAAIVVAGKDVRAALSFVDRGECAAGVVYATDAAISDNVRVVGMFPQSSHPPIVYPAALVAPASGDAMKFLRFLRSDAAGKIFAHYGFIAR